MQKRRAKRREIQEYKSITSFDDNLAGSTNQGMGHQIPPCIGHVIIYFNQQSMALPDAQSFLRYHENMEWKTVTGKPQKNWKVLAKDWIFNAIQQTKLLERQEAKRIVGIPLKLTRRSATTWKCVPPIFDQGVLGGLTRYSGAN